MLVDPAAFYTAEHIWAKPTEQGLVCVGLAPYAILQLGKLSQVICQPTLVGNRLAAEAVFATVESLKAAVDLTMPFAGTITAVNTQLLADPDLLKKDVYTTGWIVKVKPDIENPFDGLMSSSEYSNYLQRIT